MPGCKFPSDITFLNVNGRRYVGKVVPEQIYVGSLFRNSNVNTALAMSRYLGSTVVVRDLDVIIMSDHIGQLSMALDSRLISP